MSRARVLEEIRVMRFEELLDRHERGHLTQAEAAEMLGVSERTFRRWQGRWRAEGAEGLRDRRVGKPSPRRAATAEIAAMLGLYREHYEGFTVKHFHELAQKRHGYRLGYTVTRLALQQAGLVRPAPRRGAHRRRRPRRPMAGMLLHQDGSRHLWLPALGRQIDLVATMDDATGEVLSAFLVEEEGTMSSLRGLAETIAAKGLFCALYTDRGGHYFHTSEAGRVDRGHPTQVGRALAQLGIEHIAAYSPQARGRSERLFRTLQDRLVKELAQAGISDDIAAANRYIAEVYLPAHNARFAVPAELEGSAFVPVAPEQWREVLCRQESRQVGNDNCVRWRGRSLQIPPSPLRPHFVRAKVRLHAYIDGAIALFWGPHRIADFPSPGTEADTTKRAA
jgi:transposase